MINPMLRMKYIGQEEEEKKQAQQLCADYLFLCKALLFNGIDYDDLDPETMKEGRMEEGALKIGKASYTTILVPPVKNLEENTCIALKKFAQQGGKVIFCGLLPYERIDAYDFAAQWGEQELCKRLTLSEYVQKEGRAEFLIGDHGILYLHAPGGLQKSFAGELLIKTLKKIILNPTEVEIADKDIGKLVYCRREDADGNYLFLTNTGKESDKVSAVITVKDSALLFAEYDLETGECCLIGTGARLEIELEPLETKLIAVFRKAPKNTQMQKAKRLQRLQLQNSSVKMPEKNLPEVMELPLEKKVEIRVKGLNVLRLDQFLLAVNGNAEFPTIPLTFIEQVRRANALKDLEMEFTESFGTPAVPRIHYPVNLAYRTEFNIRELPKELYLMHDARAVIGEFTIEINGHVPEKSSFCEKKIYDKNNQICNIREFVKMGKNEIRILVTASKEWHGLSDPFYLLGNFGVLSAKTLVKAPQTGYFNAAVPEGYPFYSGRITYVFDMELPGEDVILKIPDRYPFYECAELSVDGCSIGTRAFAPYSWYMPSRQDISQKVHKTCKVELAVTNTLIHMLEGAKYDYEKGQIVFV